MVPRLVPYSAGSLTRFQPFGVGRSLHPAADSSARVWREVPRSPSGGENFFEVFGQAHSTCQEVTPPGVTASFG